jgi:hypothetical protein
MTVMICMSAALDAEHAHNEACQDGCFSKSTAGMQRHNLHPQVDLKAEHIGLPLFSNLLCLICIAAHPARKTMHWSLVTLHTISHMLVAHHA